MQRYCFAELTKGGACICFGKLPIDAGAYVLLFCKNFLILYGLLDLTNLVIEGNNYSANKQKMAARFVMWENSGNSYYKIFRIAISEEIYGTQHFRQM